MPPRYHLLTILFFVGETFSAARADSKLTSAITAPEVIFQEGDGLLSVEAESFFKQEKSDVRAWYRTSSDEAPDIKPDADPNHAEGASGGAYLEILPDTRKNHGEKLIHGENFINQPGKMAVLSYRVNFSKPGKYYVWARIFSTGTEDNGLHVGIDGTWPESGQRMQWTAKKQWAWGSKQRTEKVHGGVPGLLFLNVEKTGEHIIQFSMREDGFEFDQWLMTTDPDFAKPDGPVAVSDSEKGGPVSASIKVAPQPKMRVDDFSTKSQLYIDRERLLAIDPDSNKKGSATGAWPFSGGVFDLTFHAVGEDDGESSYELIVDRESVGKFTCPLSENTVEEGERFRKTFKSVRVEEAAMIEVKSATGTKDGENFSRARWSGISVVSADGKPPVRMKHAKVISRVPEEDFFKGKLFGERGDDGDGEVKISGELKQWHKVTLTLNGPFAHEKDNQPNPFTDYRMEVTFSKEGTTSFTVPGFFAADGKALESSAEAGNQWRAHFAPDAPGEWKYQVSFIRGKEAALDTRAKSESVSPFDGVEGSFIVAETDKTGRDLRGKGRLNYVGKHHLQFQGTGEYFLKAGADAPETFLGYADFDGTVANNPKKVPLKTWKPHEQDWKPGDPTWKKGKGKGMIGAINYLSGKGCNVFSFLTYNAGGDGDNVWPFISRNDKFHYDCSKLDQWSLVFDHGTAKGMYLHFKMQETENDDNVRGGHTNRKEGKVQTSLDGGDMGRERKLYCREMVARFGHNLALNWNLGEENTQTTEQQKAMGQYIADLDPYDHLIVVHTYPNQQDKIYPPLFGNASTLRGASLQNSNILDCHSQVVKWTKASAKAGRPWVVSFDEPGTASEGMPPDPGYPGMPDDFNNPSIDDTRKFALWGTLMAGGGGVEYYFGYKLPQNDLVCEDWRSRDKSWDFCRIALDFFRDEEIPLGEMRSANELIGNDKNDNSAYCLAGDEGPYLVYLPKGGERKLDLSKVKGRYALHWLNPREGGPLKSDSSVGGGEAITLKAPDSKNDWLAVLRQTSGPY